MAFVKIISGLMEFKKQTLIIVIFSLILSALAGLYAMNNGNGENPDPVEVTVTIEQPKPDPDYSDAFRKGEFKKSKHVSW